MAIFYVDVSTSKVSQYWSQITVLDGREYILDFRWNPRAQAWYMEVSDQDEVPIVNGVRLGVGTIVGRQIVDSRLWAGTLICLATTQDDSDPKVDDLGTRVLLVYDDGQPI